MSRSAEEQRPLVDGDGDACSTPEPVVPKLVTFVLACCCAVDSADGVLLSTLFRALERDLGITPAQLGLLSLVKSLSMALSYPAWGYASDVVPKSRLLTGAVLSWAATSWLVGLASSFTTLALACALLSVGLAAISPLSVAFMAELVPASSRGLMFGLLSLATSMGSVIGKLEAEPLPLPVHVACGSATASCTGTNFGMWASTTFLGWRLPYFCVGLVALPLALGLRLTLGRRKAGAAPTAQADQRKLSMRQTWAVVRRIRTVLLITFQGLFGSIPWRALDFLVIYLQCTPPRSFPSAVRRPSDAALGWVQTVGWRTARRLWWPLSSQLAGRWGAWPAGTPPTWPGGCHPTTGVSRCGPARWP